MTFHSGDSYTDSGFKVQEQLPSAAWPLGNPEVDFSQDSQITWPVYLTTKHNDNFFETYNFAKGGSTVDHAILTHGNSFTEQMDKIFMPNWGQHYSNHSLLNDNSSSISSYSSDSYELSSRRKYSNKNHTPQWHSSNSLFAVFFGINDITVTLEDPLTNEYKYETFQDIFSTYSRLVDQLYQIGARNFLFLNVPPIERGPYVRGWEYLIHSAAVTDWNTYLANMATNLTIAYNYTTVFHFDTNTLFNQVMDDPTWYTQTAGYKNTTDNCKEYYNNEEADAFDERCGIPYKEYLWRNALHPTFPVQEVIAAQVAQLLSG